MFAEEVGVNSKQFAGGPGLDRAKWIETPACPVHRQSRETLELTTFADGPGESAVDRAADGKLMSGLRCRCDRANHAKDAEEAREARQDKFYGVC